MLGVPEAQKGVVDGDKDFAMAFSDYRNLSLPEKKPK